MDKNNFVYKEGDKMDKLYIVIEGSALFTKVI